MELIKHGVRTVRRPCAKCGSLDLYGAHDMDGQVTGQWCDEHSTSNWTLMNRDGSLHDCQGNGKPQTPEPAPEPAPVVPAVPPVQAAPAADDRMGALSALLDLLAPKVDAKEVHAIVDARLRGLILPLQLEIKRDGVVRKVEGLAHKILPTVIKRLVRKHVMMVGPAGTGKSHIAHQAADALGLDFYSISLTGSTMPTEIKGYMTATGDYVGTVFRQAYEHGGVFLFDEVDNGNANSLGVVNAALANGVMAFPDGMIKRHDDFRCVAAGNTYGRGPDRVFAGRQQLDGAFLDRFTIITVDIDEPLEEALCLATGLDATRVKSCLAYVRHLRNMADTYKMPLQFGPRRSESLCDAIADGFTVKEAVDMEVRRGISDADWRKVADGAPRF